MWVESISHSLQWHLRNINKYLQRDVALAYLILCDDISRILINIYKETSLVRHPNKYLEIYKSTSLQQTWLILYVQHIYWGHFLTYKYITKYNQAYVVKLSIRHYIAQIWSLNASIMVRIDWNILHLPNKLHRYAQNGEIC